MDWCYGNWLDDARFKVKFPVWFEEGTRTECGCWEGDERRGYNI